ncbi:electron transport complex subunit RsxG [Oceanospirillum sp.]|uniref:electron transport complex subunit RsxG n=1 Tax=Oceanospirillum sp. TaxID=2021254 RepID=UPI003A9017C3
MPQKAPEPQKSDAQNEEPATETTLLQSVIRSSIGLGIFAIITAGVIAVTQVSTQKSIAENIRQSQTRSLYEILPADQIDNDLLSDTLTLAPSPILGNKEPLQIYVGRKAGATVALLFPVSNPNGYSGTIDMLVGVKRNGELAGVRVLNHKETPGLGDKVEIAKSDWILGFTGLSLENPSPEDWKVKKDGGQIDQFTGATITPRAVVSQTRAVLEYFDKHKERLLETTPANSEILRDAPKQPSNVSE